jgi:C2 domain
LKYIPVKMKLDPSESINNMGNLRVDVLDAKDLPSADRNGYSDPYCKFELNKHTVFKTKVQKKTLQPAWNEFFEVAIPSRTAAKFVCHVFDWDFGDKADVLGATSIDLTKLEPFAAHEVVLPLDGKSGTVRLRMVFRPDYVTRSRQGSSTFSGTFAAPGKIVTGVAGAPIKGVGLAAHGVGKGASFIRHGFRSKKHDDSNGSGVIDTEGIEAANGGGLYPGPPAQVTATAVGGAVPAVPALSSTPPGTAIGASPHQRTKSLAASSMHSNAVGGTGAATGTANFTVVSATGYPASANVIVYVKQLGAKPKVIHKTDHVKSSSGVVNFSDKKESFRCTCTADTQFQIQVKGHNTFGSDDDLGETLFFVDETGTGQEKTIPAGLGQVVIKSNFIFSEQSGGGIDSPKSGGFRRSLLTKKDSTRNSRETTPA